MSSTQILATIASALRSGGLDESTGLGKYALDSVRSALGVEGDSRRSAEAVPGEHGDVIDVEVHKVAREGGEQSLEEGQPAGRFLSCVHDGPAGRRKYRLYVPPLHSTDGNPRPLLVMLHGCKQTAEDFAAGTQLNALAERLGMLVAYPSQTQKANGSRCWNWFEPQHQARGKGEPATIAGMVRDVMASYPIDERRIFIAGLSAGGAMALVLGETYPELFSAVGVHSGVPYKAASDVPSAFAAMAGKGGPGNHHGGFDRRPAMRTIVIHGDRDSTVAPSNGNSIARDAVARWADQGRPLLRAEERQLVGGRQSTRVVHADDQGCSVVEHWTVHGGGHAWAGGHSAGSFTDPLGPNASKIMLDFFLQVQARLDANRLPAD